MIMTLTDLLVDSGMTRQDLADEMEISLSTAKRLQNIDSDVSDAIDRFVAANLTPAYARKEPDDYSDDDIQVLLKRRGEGETDYDIACSVGLKVHEFNKVIHNHAVAGCIKRIGRCCHDKTINMVNGSTITLHDDGSNEVLVGAD